MSRMLVVGVVLALAACRSDKTELPIARDPDTGGSPDDADGDGHGRADDCDDADPATHPGAAEVCDGADNDCDGQVDEGVRSTFYTDADGDGHGDPARPVEACEPPEGAVADATDCDDTDPDIRPDSTGACALGLTCADILDMGRSTGDGTYLIDPDGHDAGLDPFEVHCDMTTDGGGWTEIAYAEDLAVQQWFTGGDGWNWFADDFVLVLSDAQIGAVQALSTEGWQDYVGRCEGVIHYLYDTSGGHEDAFGFRFFDGTETPRGQASYAPHDVTVTADGCSTNGGEGARLDQTTDFHFASVLVPLVNVQCRDCGDEFPEQFGAELVDNPAWLR